jgi:hypothetical protein
MSTAAVGSRLVLGLHRLEPLHLAPSPAPDGPVDSRAAACLASWAIQVRDAVEPSLVLDADGRVAAMSAGAGVLLGVDVSSCAGARLLDLVVLCDFTETGVPLVDPEMSAPPLRALRSGRMSRGLMRLRLPRGTMPTYDVVGVPLAHGAGVVAFLTEV